MKKIFSITMLVMLTALFGQTAFAQNTQQTETNAQDVNKFTTRLENPNAKNPSSLIAEIKPGGTYEGSIIVINKGTQPTEINLYGADAKVKDDGDSTITFQNEKQTGIGAWTTINPAKIRLEPGEEKPAKITISVPADTELKEYKGGIAATGPEENGGAIKTTIRVATNVSIKVTNDPQPILKLSDVKVTQASTFNLTPTMWGAIGIFVASMAYFAYGTLKERKLAKSKIPVEDPPLSGAVEKEIK